MRNLIPIISAFLFLLLGCSSAPKQVVMDTEDLGTYVRLFESYAKQYDYKIEYPLNGIQLRMSAQVPDGVLGSCYVEGKHAIVTLNGRAWARMDSLERELLVMHELGHCVLKLNHDRSRDSQGRPTSIMHPNDQALTAYYRCTSCYLEQLFAAAKVRQYQDVKDAFKKHLCRSRK